MDAFQRMYLQSFDSFIINFSLYFFHTNSVSHTHTSHHIVEMCQSIETFVENVDTEILRQNFNFSCIILYLKINAENPPDKKTEFIIIQQHFVATKNIFIYHDKVYSSYFVLHICMSWELCTITTTPESTKIERQTFFFLFN